MQRPASSVRAGFAGVIGNPSLVRLAKLSAETGCEILAKAEFLNPGGSVKDRAAFYIIEDAERRGLLSAGGTVVEGTAGNTGIGLAHHCAARIVLAEPQGSTLYRWVKTGELKAEGSSISEGIGTSRVTANLEGTPIDDGVQMDDQSAVSRVYRLLREEGLCVGSSSGTNVAAAVKVARDLGLGHSIVTLLCDRGALYFQRLFNGDCLRAKGLRPQ